VLCEEEPDPGDWWAYDTATARTFACLHPVLADVARAAASAAGIGAPAAGKAGTASSSDGGAGRPSNASTVDGPLPPPWQLAMDVIVYSSAEVRAAVGMLAFCGAALRISDYSRQWHTAGAGGGREQMLQLERASWDAWRAADAPGRKGWLPLVPPATVSSGAGSASGTAPVASRVAILSPSLPRHAAATLANALLAHAGECCGLALLPTLRSRRYAQAQALEQRREEALLAAEETGEPPEGLPSEEETAEMAERLEQGARGLDTQHAQQLYEALLLGLTPVLRLSDAAQLTGVLSAVHRAAVQSNRARDAEAAGAPLAGSATSVLVRTPANADVVVLYAASGATRDAVKVDETDGEPPEKAAGIAGGLQEQQVTVESTVLVESGLVAPFVKNSLPRVQLVFATVPAALLPPAPLAIDAPEVDGGAGGSAAADGDVSEGIPSSAGAGGDAAHASNGPVGAATGSRRGSTRRSSVAAAAARSAAAHAAKASGGAHDATEGEEDEEAQEEEEFDGPTISTAFEPGAYTAALSAFKDPTQRGERRRLLAGLVDQTAFASAESRVAVAAAGAYVDPSQRRRLYTADAVNAGSVFQNIAPPHLALTAEVLLLPLELGGCAELASLLPTLLSMPAPRAGTVQSTTAASTQACSVHVHLQAVPLLPDPESDYPAALAEPIVCMPAFAAQATLLASPAPWSAPHRTHLLCPPTGTLLLHLQRDVLFEAASALLRLCPSTSLPEPLHATAAPPTSVTSGSGQAGGHSDRMALKASVPGVAERAALSHGTPAGGAGAAVDVAEEVMWMEPVPSLLAFRTAALPATAAGAPPAADAPAGASTGPPPPPALHLSLTMVCESGRWVATLL
jgi:hypothetical protein